MLTPGEVQRSKSLGVHTMHDHWLSSLLYGEAFLDDDLPVYFDGRGLVLSAFPLTGRPSPTRSDVARWVLHWVSKTNAESVMLVTPQCPDLRALRNRGLERYLTASARTIAQEVLAPCASTDELKALSRHIRRSLNGLFDVKITIGGHMDSAKLSSIERFQRKIGVTPYLAGLTTAWPAILMNSAVHFIEAWDTVGLRGFIAVHRPFEKGAVAIAMTRDESALGVTDFLYAHMLVHARKMQWDWVNLGSSATMGQHLFKLKWGRLSAHPPFALTEWRNPSMYKRRYNLWGPRTMQKTSR